MLHTREAIVNAFIELLDEIPYNKITVKAIVARCGINRNTFYYYFRDIPDLLESSAREWLRQCVRENFSFHSPMACLTPLVKYATAHRRAILHLYRSMRREDMLSGLEDMAVFVVHQYVQFATEDLQIPAEDQLLMERYYKCLLVGAALDWLEHGMSYDLLSACTRICDLLAGSGRRAFLKCAEPEA